MNINQLKLSNRSSNVMNRTGASAVEFAMIAPLIFLLLFGGIEFIRGNIVRHTANNAAYEAAREVITPGANINEAISKAEQILALAGIAGATVVITPNEITEGTRFVSATVSIPMDVNSWGVGRLLAGKTLSSNVELRTERSPGIQAQSLPTILNQPPPPPSSDQSDSANAGKNNGPAAGGDENSTPTTTQQEPANEPAPAPALLL